MKSCVISNEAGASLPLHRHEDARIIVVLEGEVCESDLSGIRTYRKGDILFRPPFCAHANKPTGAPSAFQRLPVSRKAWIGFVRRHGWRSMRGEIDFATRDQRTLLQSQTGGDSILQLLVEHSTRRNPPGGDPDAPIAGIENAPGLKPYQVTRRFQKEFGLAPSVMRSERQLLRALALLTTTCASLAEIAHDCGYADQSHMTRRLKRATGMAPVAFRRFARD